MQFSLQWGFGESTTAMVSPLIILSILTVVLAYQYTAQASAINISIQSIPDTFSHSLTSNITSPPSSEIDPRFHFAISFGETSLPKTSLFMNTVELMSQYAELGWLSRVQKRHGVFLPAYPQVEMAILPAAPAKFIENRIVVWGIWSTISIMVQGNRYQEIEAEIGWDDRLVAYIYFTIPLDYQRDSEIGSGSQIDKNLQLSLSSNGTIDTGSNTSNNSALESLGSLDDGDFDFSPKYLDSGKILTPVEAFMTILAALKNTAPAAATDKIRAPFTSQVAGIDASMAFYFHMRRGPRTQRPFFQFIHVIKTCRLLPGYLLENRKFAEVGFGIGVHGILVGSGFLVKGPFVTPSIGEVVLFGLSNNASTS